MADATGTPTTKFSIPKFNVNVDAPSGLGGNTQMDAIDAVLANLGIAGLVANDVPVYDNVAGKFKKATGTPSSSTFLRGDGSWAVPSTATELDYAQITSNTNVTGTTSAAPTTVITGAAVVYDGSTIVIAEFGTPNLSKGTSNIQIGLYEDGSIKAVLAFVSTAAQLNGAWRMRFTPSAGTHTYSIRGFVDAGTGSVSAGTGTAGANMPAYLRITKAA